ncbi:uncharacterized protein B0P05DRAFT_473135 [Gilbertella persicaria]|uniref:uncharacterized protein n=1 Tax=Gilbertella persicaria TaxID=101096 RepID=UPI00221E9175|nr:uncharacterized protein B0P05DRAFT_473135 [Gilbertella persicaria]KAI8074211.1 hypothetical protein B0P05DRAFT_473135 [Gilbertella persicaria]
MATGAVVKVISQSASTGGHSNKITRVMLNPKNHLQLYTASLDGTIKLWDYNDDILLKTYHVDFPIEHMVMSPKHTNTAYIVVKSTDVHDNSIVYCFSFESSHMRRICSVRECTTIDISQDGEWLAFGARFKVYVWPINEEEEDVSETQLTQHVFVEQVTVLKFHPFKPMLSVGDRSGKITHLTNYPSEKDLIRSVIHWHHMPVRCLTFMADGSYLLSGGEESVLVIWQLETGYKQFLPRLGGGIASIAITPNHRFYCVGLDDNSICLVNSVTQSMEQVIQGLQYAQADNALNPLSTGLMIEPRNHHVVLNGVQGSLQFYDAVADSHVMDLEVVPMNRIVRSGEKEIIHAHVAHVAFLRTGEWMATVDMRDDKITTPELFLKFWRWDPDTQAYKLHTRVDYPHTKPIRSLVFNPVSRQGPMAITTSDDKTFKVWNLSTDLGRPYHHQQGEAAAAWICRSVGVYRDCAPHAVSFSEDGSILAVAFGQAITIWDPYLNSIQAVLAQPNPEAIEKLCFLGDTCPYLIVKSRSHLYVWNMLTCQVWWSYKVSVDHLTVDPVSNQFAIVRNHARSNQARITVFDPKSPKPIALQHVEHTCLAVAWLSRDSNEQPLPSTLLCLNNKYEFGLYAVKSRDTQIMEAEQTQRVSLLDNTPETSLLDDMYGKRESERETDEQTRIRLKTVQSMREEAMSINPKKRHEEEQEQGGLSAPSHVLPGVDVLFDTFMSSLMTLRIENTDKTAVEDMELDAEAQLEQEISFIHQDNITQSAQQDLPLLNQYFAQELEQNPVSSKATTQDSSSSSDNDSEEEEDPSNIDW